MSLKFKLPWAEVFFRFTSASKLQLTRLGLSLNVGPSPHNKISGATHMLDKNKRSSRSQMEHVQLQLRRTTVQYQRRRYDMVGLYSVVNSNDILRLAFQAHD